MELLKLATEWAKAEVFSTRFFIYFAIFFLAASAGFWQLGKTDLAKAYTIPMLIAGLLLLTIGLGLFYTNKNRITQFEKAYSLDKVAFKDAEITRAESTLKEYSTVVFKAIPILICIAALCILFFDDPKGRAYSITAIAMLVVILLVDGTAHARITNYYKQLKSIELKK